MPGSAILKKAFEGKWALVTGASAGIGEALAIEVAAAGANLILTARRAERLETLARRLGSEHKIQTQVIPADLADPVVLGVDRGAVDVLLRILRGGHGRLPLPHAARASVRAPRRGQGQPSYPARTVTNSSDIARGSALRLWVTFFRCVITQAAA